MAIRVVQWTTGNVGKESVKAISANPALELVGCFAWSPDKVGVDVAGAGSSTHAHGGVRHSSGLGSAPGSPSLWLS